MYTEAALTVRSEGLQLLRPRRRQGGPFSPSHDCTATDGFLLLTGEAQNKYLEPLPHDQQKAGRHWIKCVTRDGSHVSTEAER